jgi:cytochrome P450
VTVSTIADEISRWHPGRAEDIQSDLTDLTLRVASRALLGTDTAEDEVGRALREQFEVVLGWISHRFSHLAAPPVFVPTRRNRAMKEARCELKTIVRGLIAERRESGVVTPGQRVRRGTLVLIAVYSIQRRRPGLARPRASTPIGSFLATTPGPSRSPICRSVGAHADAWAPGLPRRKLASPSP